MMKSVTTFTDSRVPEVQITWEFPNDYVTVSWWDSETGRSHYVTAKWDNNARKTMTYMFSRAVECAADQFKVFETMERGDTRNGVADEVDPYDPANWTAEQVRQSVVDDARFEVRLIKARQRLRAACE